MSEPAGLADLQAALRDIEPNARLVPLRGLRRAMRLSRTNRDFHASLVHDRAWVVTRDDLFTVLTPTELGLSENEPPGPLLLLPIQDSASDDPWLPLWRTLFHARLDRDFDGHVAAGRITADQLQAVRDRLGPAQWAAVRQVLQEESLCDELDGTAVVVRELFAFGCEVQCFAAKAWDDFFPHLDSTAVFEPFLPLIDVGLHLRETKPPAAAELEPRDIPPRMDSVFDPGGGRGSVADDGKPANDVRSAVLMVRQADPRAIEAVSRLARRLRAALGLDDRTADRWHHELVKLLEPAAVGRWPVARRLLYEVQRTCLALERPAFALEPWQWLRSLGRMPLKRHLPKTTWLTALRRLRAAGRYAERLESHASPILSELIERAMHQSEVAARDDLRGHIAAVMDEVGIVPRSRAEDVSRQKLVEELLDTACARGFLRMSDLRDAIARNRVKLDDLAGPGEWLRGDALLRANGLLASRLEGVYRRGEIYLRLLQRLCSIFFATRVGRWLTKYVALPFGGSFVILEGLYHMLEAAEGFLDWVTRRNSVEEIPSHEAPASGLDLPTWLGMAVFLLLVLHVPAFRRGLMRGARFMFIKVPRAVRRSPLLHAVLHNRVTRFVRRYLLVPVAFGSVAGLALQFGTRDWISALLVGGGTALFFGAFFRTPYGRALEDRVDEAAARVWRIVSANFLMGLLTLVLQFFVSVFEAIDRTIHAVDEYFRFREGDNRLAFAFKLVFGAGWLAFAYLFRFAWTLLVEPQINPIKHFPVVTVSHKLLLPLIPSLAENFDLTKETTGLIVSGVPGIFGFLVWELKENWRMYRANASPTLRPAIVGSHGERVRGLLRPGFHSGVVPKTFTKLRRAVRAGQARRASRHRHTIAHVAEAMHRFADRGGAAVLAASYRWAGRKASALHPILTANRILLPFDLGDPASPVVVALEERGGWVIAGVESGSLPRDLTTDQRQAFADVLAALYKLAGVDFVREQVAATFGPRAFRFDARDDGLMVPMPDGGDLFYEHDDGTGVMSTNRFLPAELIYSDLEMPWSSWADRWDRDAAGETDLKPLVPGWTFLPRERG